MWTVYQMLPVTYDGSGSSWFYPKRSHPLLAILTSARMARILVWGDEQRKSEIVLFNSEIEFRNCFIQYIILFVLSAYLKRGAYNIIVVDWGKLAALPWYITAVRNTKQVGHHVARFVKWLDNNNAVPMSMLHVIGFSLGAETAGFMGKSLAPKKVVHSEFLDEKDYL